MSKTPPSKAPADPAADYLHFAALSHADGAVPRHEARAAVRAAKNILRLHALDAAGLAALTPDERAFATQVRADLAAAEIDDAFLRPLAALCARFEPRLDASPADRRQIAALSDEDKARVGQAAARVARLKTAIASVAKARNRLADAADFGRGASFAHDNPADVEEALRQFLEGAAKHTDLIAAARLKPAQLAALAADRAAMDDVLHRKQLRGGGKASGTEARDVERLALESFFDDYRGRAAANLEDDAARGRVLGLLPRAPERRRAPAAEDKPADAAKPPATAGETPATAPPPAAMTTLAPEPPAAAQASPAGGTETPPGK